ncbi:hypothetical protein SLEP1_g32308 [Rubroshorea leprosula]|uniref:Pectate lyase n=1 Tax=Rubroshorea leprosula TaxID=152421 RepID=A0AAV5KCV4_9ROSI|nr:hypothetical protein SLEP1_g32308 [Rubroshorea leprosula]
MAAINRSFVFFLSFSVIIPTLLANIGDFDDYWKQREAEAKKYADLAFNPRPEEVTQHFNAHVARTLAELNLNSSRRELRMKRSHKGQCMAYNPIDKCWRCDPNWANNRKRLADCSLGFARGTIGGKMGEFYVVTDGSDDNVADPKPGTLRHAVIQKGPLWIIFARSMIIRLSQELIVSSDKTIDARGANVHIAYGAGITLQFVRNVIIHGLHIHDIVPCDGGMIRDSVDHVGFRTKSDGDGISIFGSSNIWIDHVSASNCYDGLIDAIQGSTAITISNCHFTHHNEVMLFGASDTYSDDTKMQITVAFTHFGKGLVQRMPRCRWGFIHVVNNDYSHWLMYAIGGSSKPTIISQGNRFVAPPNAAAKEVTKRDYASQQEWANWPWRSEGDMMVNGAFFVQSGNPDASKKFSSEFMIKAYPATMVPLLTKYSGSLTCFPGKPC